MLKIFFTVALACFSFSTALASVCESAARGAATAEVHYLIASNEHLKGIPVYLVANGESENQYFFTAEFEMVAIYNIRVSVSEKCEVISVMH